MVDVKPARRLADLKVASTFEWTREIVEARGWRYEVATEPSAVELENVRNTDILLSRQCLTLVA